MSKISESSIFSMSLKQYMAVAVLVACLFSGTALAQTLYGTLIGNVTDQSGAAVVGAKIEAVNVATGVTTQAISDNSGIYRVEALQPGTYKVTVSAPNFNTQLSEHVSVAASTVVRVDAALKVAQQKDTI